MPSEFGDFLLPHEVFTTRAQSWNGIRNGKLLALAEATFDAFLTIDKGIVYQHPAGKFALRIVCFRPYSSRLVGMTPYVDAILTAFGEMREGDVRLLERLPRDR